MRTFFGLTNCRKKVQLIFSEFAFDKNDGGIIGRVENYDANRVDQIRTNIIKDIKLGEKKRKKEEKKIKVEKVKVKTCKKNNRIYTHFIFRIQESQLVLFFEVFVKKPSIKHI